MTRPSIPPGASPSPLPSIDYAHRVAIFGATETGKSTLARRLVEAVPFFTSNKTPAPKLVIDPGDSSLTALPGAVTFSDPGRLPDAWVARFVPTDPVDLDAYDALYRSVYAAGGPRYTWVDEAGIVLPANGAPRGAVMLIVQGRKRQLGHLALHTRPVEVTRHLIAQSRHVFAFDLPHPDDRRVLAAVCGIPPSEFDAAMAALPPHGYLWWAQAERRLIPRPPLQIGRR